LHEIEGMLSRARHARRAPGTEGLWTRRTIMLTKTKMALAVLLVFASGSAVLAQSRTHHRGTAAGGRTAPTSFEQQKPAVKPFTAEEKAWFDRASRVF
jgi:hypothetical protein